MGFARKETDSYRDSGLAGPKGGKQGEMGVYGGLLNETVPLFIRMKFFLLTRENEQKVENTQEQVKLLFLLVVCFAIPEWNLETKVVFVQR